MGKFDKYKKSKDSKSLDKYKKKSGSSFDEVKKEMVQKDKPAAPVQEKGSVGGTILIVVLGIVTVGVWFFAITKVLG